MRDPPPTKRRRTSHETGNERVRRNHDSANSSHIHLSTPAKQASHTVAPFLARHIPKQYAPDGGDDASDGPPSRHGSSTKFCYRHQPDLKCRRQANEPSMDQLQRELENLGQADQEAIAHTWSIFSASPARQRNLILQGLLTQCCFSQLSYLAAMVRDLVRIDFLTILPPEISFRILSFLDTASLCKAARVSQRWRLLADDDVVWHRMCEQHIDRKCLKCGWGLPLLERKRLRASKRQMQLRAASMSSSDSLPRTRPWKDVYKDRFMVGTNWKYGRCDTQVLRGHTNGVMCLQFDEQILASGSYDTSIKIWDLHTGLEIRTLRGHTSAVRCLQFDDTKLISGGLDCKIKVWNWRTGECLSTLGGHSGGIIGLHFDSSTLASGSVDCSVRIWNFDDKSAWALRGHADWVNDVKIDSASRTVFSASDDSTIKLWDLDRRTCIKTLEGHVGQVQQVVLLPHDFHFEDEDLEMDTDHDGTCSTISVSTNDTHTDPEPYGAGFSAERTRAYPPQYILSSALDSTIRLWDTRSGKPLRTYFGHVEGIWALAADSLRVVSGAQDRTVKIWDSKGRCERTFIGHTAPVTCIGLSDERMASGGEDCEIRIYSF